MTALTRRHVLAGAAATVAAAALPAVAVAEAMVAPRPVRLIQFLSTREYIDFIATGADLSDIEMEFI
jgi:hypothetical protein